MKKVVLKLDLHDDKAKQKALKAVSAVSGIDSIAVDMKESKMSVIGTMDPVEVTDKLRKYGRAEIDFVGPHPPPVKEDPAKKAEEEKKKKEEEEKKAEEEKKKKEEEAKKTEEQKKKEEEEKKAAEEKKKKETAAMIAEIVASAIKNGQDPYRMAAQDPYKMAAKYYVEHVADENPNACCVIS